LAEWCTAQVNRKRKYTAQCTVYVIERRLWDLKNYVLLVYQPKPFRNRTFLCKQNCVVKHNFGALIWRITIDVGRRECWIIYSGPGFLAVRRMIWLLPPLPSVSCLSFSVFLCVAFRAYWHWRGWGRSQAFDGQKAWSSINYSIPSGWPSAVASEPVFVNV
jgi:hypothetical protein